jgi:2-keto-myo-inositol isomerase
MVNRRTLLAAGAAAAATFPLRDASAAPAAGSNTEFPVKFALNTSTIRGHKLGIEAQIDVAAEAGYDGIEPWIRDIEQFRADGGRLADLRKRIEDAGLFVASAIGFANWISADKATREQGLEQARNDMALVAELGGQLIAAPPIGAHRADSERQVLQAVADRYRELCEVGQAAGVKPQLELWGFSPNLSRLGELVFVATEAQHPYACVLPDFYHIYKGGNEFEGLRMIEASKMHCFHINDYPADPPRERISDKDRVFPGDGVCPLPSIVSGLIENGFRGTFSLELFNPEYWKRDVMEVAREGLAKSKSVVGQALEQTKG